MSITKLENVAFTIDTALNALRLIVLMSSLLYLISLLTKVNIYSNANQVKPTPF